MTDELLPRSVLSSPHRARAWVAAIAGVASGGAALAGCWIRFQDGLSYRLVIALTSALFGAVAIDVALKARDPWAAIGRTFGLSTVLGIVSTIIPAFMVAAEDHFPIAACLVGGLVFGAFTGVFYGFFLAAVAGLTWKQIASRTHDGADRAALIAAGWSIVPALGTLYVAMSTDYAALSEWASEAQQAAHRVAGPLGLFAGGVILSVAVAFAVVAYGRMRRRKRWLSVVAFGDHPRWGLRDVGPSDDVAHLPRLGEGSMILEHRSERAVYRANATGEAIAIL